MNPIVVLIPITGIIFGIGLVMLIIYLDYRRRSDALKHTHEERIAAIQRGIELPPAPSPPRIEREDWIAMSLSRRRASGLTLLLIGAAVMVAMWETGNEYFWWGLVPAAIGIATLVAVIWDALNWRTARAEAARKAEKQLQD